MEQPSARSEETRGTHLAVPSRAGQGPSVCRVGCRSTGGGGRRVNVQSQPAGPAADELGAIPTQGKRERPWRRRPVLRRSTGGGPAVAAYDSLRHPGVQVDTPVESSPADCETRHVTCTGQVAEVVDGDAQVLCGLEPIQQCRCDAVRWCVHKVECGSFWCRGRHHSRVRSAPDKSPARCHSIL